MNILVADDEKEIAELVEIYLKMKIIMWMYAIQVRRRCTIYGHTPTIWPYWM